MNRSLDQTFLIADVWCLMFEACCETNLEDSIDFSNFSVMSYLPLIWKDSVTHIHGFTVYVKKGFPFTWVLSLENSENSYLRFLICCLTSFSSINHCLRLYAQFLMLLQASKNCMPNWDKVHIRFPNLIEKPKISGMLLSYVVSCCFLDTLLQYYSPLFFT